MTEDGVRELQHDHAQHHGRQLRQRRAAGEGREGNRYWFKGVNNYVTDNVAADIMSDANDAAYRFELHVPYHLGNVRIPKFQGADTTVDANVTVRNANAMPILEFARNEVYGATESGLTYWWVGAADTKPLATQWSVIKDLRVWNVHNRAIFHYPSSKMRIQGLIVRSTDPGPSSACVSSVSISGTTTPTTSFW